MFPRHAKGPRLVDLYRAMFAGDPASPQWPSECAFTDRLYCRGIADIVIVQEDDVASTSGSLVGSFVSF